MGRLRAWGMITLLLLVATSGYWAGQRDLLAPDSAVAQDECFTFQETGKTVCGRFLEYWRQNGGLAQQGLPISDAFNERSDVNGQTYLTQYFERAVFELHPENNRPYDVLLSLLGREKYAERYPAGLPTGQAPLQAGQTVVLPGSSGTNATFRVAITEVRETTTIPASGCCAEGATAKGKFVIIFMRVTNLGQEPTSLASFRIRDQQGRSFDTTSDFEASYSAQAYYQRKSYSTTVQPGLAEDVIAVFDVAPDGTSFAIVPRTR